MTTVSTSAGAGLAVDTITSPPSLPPLHFVSFEDSERRRATRGQNRIQPKRADGAPRQLFCGAKQAVPVPVCQDDPNTANGRRRQPVRSFTGLVTDGKESSSVKTRSANKRPRPAPLTINCDAAARLQGIASRSNIPCSSNKTLPPGPLGPGAALVMPLDTMTGHRGAQNTSPPIIVVTPARDYFYSPSAQQADGQPRPASSFYSPFTARTPKEQDLSRFSCVVPTAEVSEERTPLLYSQGLQPEAQTSRSYSRQIDRLPSTSRRSRGWWNVVSILSPFSARSTVARHFLRSPVAEHGLSDKDDVALGSDCRDQGVREGLYNSSNDGSKSAPPALPGQFFARDAERTKTYNAISGTFRTRTGTDPAGYVTERREIKQSTAPGPTSPDPLEDMVTKDSLETGLSSSESEPTQHTCQCHCAHGKTAPVLPQSEEKAPSKLLIPNTVIFSSPSEEELRGDDDGNVHARFPADTTTVTPSPPRLPMGPAASSTEHFADDHNQSSSLASPRHLEAQSMHAAFEQQRQQLQPTEHTARPLPQQTRPPMYARPDFRGLGISDCQSSQKPQAHLVRSGDEKPELWIDKYGQLAICQKRVEGHCMRPWYRRFFWLLTTISAATIILLVVLIAMFVPRHGANIAM